LSQFRGALHGLDPNFYVTSAKVSIIGDNVGDYGETLYLSAPLLRILKPREFIAVIAHELGHFAGKDTIYTNRFAPIYAQLTRSLSGLSDMEHTSDLAKLPGFVLLSLLLAIFSTKERAIGRKRELEADKVAASVAGPEPLVSALVKISLVSHKWQEVRQGNVDALNSGYVTDNLCDVFIRHMSDTLPTDSTVRDRLVVALESEKGSHPTDTHPTIAERARSLKVDVENVAKQAIVDLRHVVDAPENGVLPEYMENYLTMLEHRVLIQLGHASIPEETGTTDQAQ
jgi:Zn-dependent protease with chaperone function